MKITKNNFIYKIVTDKAREIWNNGLFELYILNEDETETLIEDWDDLNYALCNDIPIGIEVGFFDAKQINLKNKNDEN